MDYNPESRQTGEINSIKLSTKTIKMQKLDKTAHLKHYFLRSTKLETMLNTIAKVLDNQNLRMIQLGGNPMFSLVCATYSILNS